MTHSSTKPSMRQGFTLVEMLVVIAIIGILAGLTAAVAVKAIGTAKRADIVMQMSQLDISLKAYKDKYGEYPPDGSNLADINRHFKRMFPKADLKTETDAISAMSGNKVQINFANMDPSTCLAFFLGGMPEDLVNALEIRRKTGTFPSTFQFNPNSRLIGFSSNPINPLSDNSSTSRVGPYYEFDPARLVMTDTILRSYLGNINVQVPFVYYRAEISQKGLEYVIPSTNPSKLKFASAALGTPRPYWSEQTKGWVNPTSYQILFCGFDNKFGPGNSFPSGTTIWTPNDVPKLYVPGSTAIDPNRTLVFPYVADPTNPDNSNFDDITNFAGGAVGDSIP